MFFIFSKLIYPFLDPVFWLGLGAVFFIFKKTTLKRRKKIWIVSFKSFVAILLFLTIPVINQPIIKFWEGLVQDTNAEVKYDYLIVPSGYVGGTTTMEWSAAVDRIMVALEIYDRGGVEKIILTGGNGYLDKSKLSEAPRVKDYFVKKGYLPEIFIVEPDSSNSWENAVNTRELLTVLIDPGKKPKILLITSAMHMFRIAGAFKKVGLEPDILKVDYLVDPNDFGSYEPVSFFPSTFGSLQLVNLIKEVIGVVAYSLFGKFSLP